MRYATWAILALSLAGCGGERQVSVKTRSVEPEAPTMGPKASPEEAKGEVPPLRSVAKAEELVPPKLVPPEAPADPSFGPDGEKDPGEDPGE